MSIYQIPKFLYDEIIYTYLEELVKLGVNDFTGLHDNECDNLTVKIIDVLGTDAYNVLIGSDNFDKALKQFSNFLKSSSSEDAYDFLNQIKLNALDYYAYDIGQLIEEIKESHKISRLRDNNFIPYTDKQTGELHWSKTA